MDHTGFYISPEQRVQCWMSTGVSKQGDYTFSRDSNAGESSGGQQTLLRDQEEAMSELV